MMTIFNAIEWLGNFIEIFCMFKFIDLFSSKKIKKILLILSCIVLSSLTLVFNNIELISPFLSFIIIFMCYLVQLLIRKEKPIKLLILTLFFIALLFVIDFVSTSVIGIILKIDISDIIHDYNLKRIPVLVTSKLVLIFTIDFLYKFSLANKNNKKANIILYVSTIAITIISSLMYYTQLINKENNSDYLVFVFFVIMLIMIISIYIMVASVMENGEKDKEYILIKQQNDLLNKYISEQEEIFLSWKESIHNHKHKLIAINQMLDKKQYSDAKEYIDKELDLFKNKAFYVHTGNNTIDVLLSNKMSLAKKYGIVFTTNIAIGDTIKISDVDLSVILGNLLDNAFEAVQNEDEKNIYLKISATDELLKIKVTNTYTKSDLTTETKKDKMFHGIGIKSIKKIILGYGGEFTLTLNNGTVTAVAII